MMRDAYVRSLNEIMESVRVLIDALEEALNNTRRALFTQDIDLARQVNRMGWDGKFDDMIRTIMRHDLTIQVLQSPVANDWRNLVGTFRVLSELERIADHCSDIATYTVRILERNPKVKKATRRLCRNVRRHAVPAGGKFPLLSPGRR